jgi:hypothetical protein
MMYQLIYLALCLIGLGMTFAKHGEPKTGKHNGWVSLISVGITFFILYKCDFFNVFLP